MAGEREQAQAMQRIKVGLFGLVMVILLISFASAIMRTATREAPVTAIGAPKPEVVANMSVVNAQASAGEPLAEIGVAPVAANVQGAAAGLHR